MFNIPCKSDSPFWTLWGCNCVHIGMYTAYLACDAVQSGWYVPTSTLPASVNWTSYFLALVHTCYSVFVTARMSDLPHLIGVLLIILFISCVFHCAVCCWISVDSRTWCGPQIILRLVSVHVHVSICRPNLDTVFWYSSCHCHTNMYVWCSGWPHNCYFIVVTPNWNIFLRCRVQLHIIIM